jgi:hypothetical protein
VQTRTVGDDRENVSAELNTISSKPILTRFVQSWHVSPGMVFAVAIDTQRQIWIVESTPVGAYFWTVEQAMELPQGMRTRRALRAAIRLGRRLQEEARQAAAEALKLPDMLPRFDEEADRSTSPAIETKEETDVTPEPIRPARRRQVKEPIGV